MNNNFILKIGSLYGVIDTGSVNIFCASPENMPISNFLDLQQKTLLVSSFIFTINLFKSAICSTFGKCRFDTSIILMFVKMFSATILLKRVKYHIYGVSSIFLKEKNNIVLV